MSAATDGAMTLLPNEMHHSYADMRATQALCDVTLQASDSATHIHAHKLVLAANSAYFHALFLGAGQSMRTGSYLNTAQVENIEHNVLLQLVEAMYSGQIQVTRATSCCTDTLNQF